MSTENNGTDDRNMAPFDDELNGDGKLVPNGQDGADVEQGREPAESAKEDAPEGENPPLPRQWN